MNEHIRYEWQMLQASRVGLIKLFEGAMILTELIPGGEKSNSQFLFNLLHQNFCLHARNLINWKTSGLNLPDSVINRVIKDILVKIEDQIVTLVLERRTAKVEEKISHLDRDILYEYIKNFMVQDEA